MPQPRDSPLATRCSLLIYDRPMPDIDALLRSTALFRRVGPDDRARVSAVSRVTSYQRGETIFTEGDPPDDLLVIASGRVKVFKMTPAGKDVILEIFGPGDPLAAVAAYEARPYPASAVALEETTCILVPRQTFFALLGSRWGKQNLVITEKEGFLLLDRQALETLAAG
jgi:CRP-like cAMP-binding protein